MASYSADSGAEKDEYLKALISRRGNLGEAWRRQAGMLKKKLVKVLGLSSDNGVARMDDSTRFSNRVAFGKPHSEAKAGTASHTELQ